MDTYKLGFINLKNSIKLRFGYVLKEGELYV